MPFLRRAARAAVFAGTVSVFISASAQVSDSMLRPPVSPVLSPPLREVSPIKVARDPGRPRDRRRLPYKGALPGAAPSRLVDVVVQSAAGVNAPTPTGVSFDGLAANGSAPPDPSGKVGPSHYVTWINTQFAIYDKAGTLLYGPAAGNTLFTSLGGACAAQNDGDPVVQYDALADRWVLSQFAVAAPAPVASHQCVAVSKTGDPLGAWYLYDFPTDATNFVDYPKLTVWPDAYYMTAHLFNPAGTLYLGPMLYSFDRSRMLAGLSAGLQSVNLDVAANKFGQLVADFDGLTLPPALSPAYVFAPAAPDWDGTGPGLHFWTASSTWGPAPTLTVTAKTDIPTAAYNTDLCGFSFNCLPQLGTTQRLDALTGQLMFRAAYRNLGGTESIVLSHTVNALVPPANQAAVRWYEIRTPATTPTVFQESTYAPTSAHRWVPSLAMDASGNMAVGYSITDSTMYPSINLSGRLAGDPLGTLGAETTMFAGLGAQTGGLNRWGDYTQMEVDPREGCTFWYINQYQPANGLFNWKTRIASFRFPSCTSPARGTITGLVTDGAGNPIANAVVQVDAGYSGATDGTGRYVIVAAPGAYNVTATDPGAGCTPSASQPATVTAGAATTLDFTLTGSAQFTALAVAVDDSIGNGNGVVNRNECFRIAVDLGNTGCVDAGSVSATLTTSTPGVLVVSGSASYGSLARGAHVPGSPAYSLATTPSFVCGTDIAFTLTVNSSAGPGTINFTIPTCAAPPAVFIGSVTPASPVETGRLLRNGFASTCAGRACPGDFVAGANRNFASHTVTNASAVPRCVTVTAITSGCTLPGQQVIPVAYLGSFDPSAVCANYLGDGGASPTPGPVTFDATVPAGQSVVLVMQAAEGSPAFTGCGSYTLSVSGLLDNADGGRPTATATGGGAICLGQSVGLSGSGGTTCSWSPAAGLDNPASCAPSASPTVTTSYTLTVASATGCTSAPSSPVTVTVNAPPTPPVLSAPPCAGAGSPNQTASAPAHAGSTYAWTIGNGTITAGQGTSQITFTAGAAGTPLTLSVTETSAAGCVSGPGNAVVTVTAAPAASNTGPYCAGATIALSTPAVTGAIYAWTGPNGFASALQNPTIPGATAASAGLYGVTTTVGGCTSATGTTTVVVNPVPPAPSVTAPAAVAAGSPNQTASVPAHAGSAYAWTIGNGSITAGQGTSQITFTAGAAGTPLTLSVTETSAAGCVSAAGNATVAVCTPPPTPTASNTGPYCEGATIALSTPAVTGAVYAWTGPNGFASVLQNPTVPGATAASAGLYGVTVTVGGCTSAAGTTAVVVNPAPPAPSISAPAVVGAGSPNRTASVAFDAGSIYAWTIGNGTITAGQGTNQITFTAGTAGILSLSVVQTNAASCPSPPATTNIGVTTPGSAVAFYSLPPCRVIDTRSETPPALAAAATRVFPVTGGTCGIPATARSISVNLTVTGPSAAGHLTVFPGDHIAPGTSSINFASGQTRANNAVLQLSGDGAGTIGVFNGSAGEVDFILDVNGFFE